MITPLKRSVTKEQALQKLKHYCAYQERCHQEVKEKLYDLGLYQKDVEELIAQLIEENYVNEERFAIQFAGGKFRIKKWGRLKIRHALKQKKVSGYCIKKALQQIDEEAYRDTIQKLAEAKWKMLTAEKNIFMKQRKVTDHLLHKGFEADFIKEVTESLAGK